MVSNKQNSRIEAVFLEFGRMKECGRKIATLFSCREGSEKALKNGRQQEQGYPRQFAGNV